MIEPTRIIVLPVHYLCDARCSMCNIWKRLGGPKWEPDELRRILADPLLAQNVQVVNVTGGEPTLRNDLLQVVQSIVEPLTALQVLSLQTHGLNPSLVRSRIGPIVEWFKEFGRANRKVHLDVNISLDGPHGVHDRVRGRRGAFTSVMKSVEIVKAMLAGLDHSAVLLNCTIVRQNVSYLRETQQVARKVGLEITYTIPQTTDTYMANDTTTDRFSLSELDRSEAIAFLHEIVGLTQGRGALSRRYCEMMITLLKTGKRNIGCPLARWGLFMDPDGSALPCWRSSSLRLGNLRKSSVSSVLEARTRSQFRETLRAFCGECPSNCYVDWGRRMFARRCGPSSITSHR